MQCFRLMGMPDKVIAFDSLPETMMEGFELCRADGFPRHWKQWLGVKEKITKIPPEKDFLTGQVRKFDPIVENDSFFYLVDWTNNPVMERWRDVCDYVRSHVAKETRLKDNLDDMALPLAPDKTSGVTLEPEEVVVIKIIPELISISQAVNQVPRGTIEEEKPVAKTYATEKCDEPHCPYFAEGQWAKNAIRMHKMKMHKKEKIEVK